MPAPAGTGVTPTTIGGDRPRDIITGITIMRGGTRTAITGIIPITGTCITPPTTATMCTTRRATSRFCPAGIARSIAAEFPITM